MNLFDQPPVPNLLPMDGIAHYYGKIYNNAGSQAYLQSLLSNIAWKNDEAIIYGKHITTKRKAAWYGDTNFEYTYSNTTKYALEWTKELLELKSMVEKTSGSAFNSCVLNLYHSGDEGMAWHSDDEQSLAKNSSIASLSFGAERKFCFKHKGTKLTVSVMLENGSLLLMAGTTQTNWQHSLPKSKKVGLPRINLTFRTMV